jgi:cytochrome P450/NADPH-cytochrome P450 reductase
VRYTVFGCGNTEWRSTYQEIPTLVDRELASHGAVRVHPRGEGNAAGDFDADYRAWHSGLWADLAHSLDLPQEVASATPTEARLSITLTNRQVTNPVVVSYAAHPAVVRDNRELIPLDGGPRERSVHHVEIALPAAMGYQTGDHLGVLPRNGYETIRRVMAHFGLDAGQWMTIIPNSGTHTHLPIDDPTPVLGVLGCCVELQDTASRDALAVLARHTKDPTQRAALEGMVGDDEASAARYRQRVHAKHLSVLDLLDEFPSCALPFEEYLDLLPPLRPRFYSISSSPLVTQDTCSITTQLVEAPARSGTGRYRGVSSSYLARTPVNGTLFVFVKHPAIPFRPPESPQTPMIMVGAGTGLAPFRGFIQDRAALQAQGVAIGPSLFFFGCRNSETDLLYPEELAAFEDSGVARVERCYSDEPGVPRRFVQDAMLECADEVWDLMQREARVLVCGNAATIAPGVRSSLAAIFRERTGASEADGEAWIRGLRSGERLVEDIWA